MKIFSILLISLALINSVLAKDTLWQVPDTAKYSEDTLLVKFKTNTSASALANILNTVGVLQEKTFQYSGISVLKITDKNKNVKDVLNSLTAYNSVIEYAEPDYILTLNRTPNDPMFNQLWG